LTNDVGTSPGHVGPAANPTIKEKKSLDHFGGSFFGNTHVP